MMMIIIINPKQILPCAMPINAGYFMHKVLFVTPCHAPRVEVCALDALMKKQNEEKLKKMNKKSYLYQLATMF
jgi:hypothetical protein